MTTTTQQTALQIAARKLIRAQESASLLGRFLGSDHPKLADIATCIQDDLNGVGQALEAAGATYQPKYPNLADHPMIFIDPDINFGMPSVRGKSIRADVLSGPARAGDTAENVADWYEVPVEQVEAAVRWSKACEFADRPASDPHGLEALRKIEGSRKEGEALARCLRATLVVAEALDKARGNWVGDMAHTDRGETPGTEYAEAIQALVLRLQGELGAEGGGRE